MKTYTKDSQYLNQIGETNKYQGSITINDVRVFNPTEEQLIENGWTEYVAPKPQPIPEPSAEEKRQEAYRMEADQFLIAHQGYLAEGETMKADEQLKLYLAKKKEIRKRFAE